MLSRDLLRSDISAARQKLDGRGVEAGLLDRWAEVDDQWRHGLTRVQELKHQRNEASKAIGKVKQAGGDAAEQIAAVGHLKVEIEAFDARVDEAEKELREIEMQFPNFPHESVPEGCNDKDNRVERLVGEPTQFDFEPKAHWDLGPELGILDFERAAKVAGARFSAYFGAGARLERALINFMLDLHTGEHGYTEVLPPFLVNSDSLVGTGQLPKFADDLFHLEGTDYSLVPTAEVPLTNLLRDEIVSEADLPVRFAAYTPCFRSEAGSYGKDVRGLIRQHQFNKVELVQFVRPEESYETLEALTGHAEEVLRRLHLPYRVVTLCRGDLGFSSAKTYDLEVWLPGQDDYREISSCSNFEAFQARRANLRYRPEGGKVRQLHTLNGSGLAVGRTVVAILENFQQADGTVVVPPVLRPYMGGLERIEKRST